jgi:hypothetical protein
VGIFRLVLYFLLAIKATTTHLPRTPPLAAPKATRGGVRGLNGKRSNALVSVLQKSINMKIKCSECGKEFCFGTLGRCPCCEGILQLVYSDQSILGFKEAFSCNFSSSTNPK